MGGGAVADDVVKWRKATYGRASAWIPSRSRPPSRKTVNFTLLSCLAAKATAWRRRYPFWPAMVRMIPEKKSGRKRYDNFRLARTLHDSSPQALILQGTNCMNVETNYQRLGAMFLLLTLFTPLWADSEPHSSSA